METKSFFFGLYCADFLVDTNHLSNQAVGCYIKLLCRMFLERDCTLQYKHAHKICGYQSEGKNWTKLWKEELEPLFIPVDNEGFFSNRRLLKEKHKIDVIRERRSEAGKRGVIAKRKYRSQSTQANAKSLLKPSLSNIKLNKESNNIQVVDKFSSIQNTDHISAVNILNNKG
tara:strand:+ start:3575 stop:4090 length:516 start_codon:yes stop_codon:yes gene_type:complete